MNFEVVIDTKEGYSKSNYCFCIVLLKVRQQSRVDDNKAELIEPTGILWCPRKSDLDFKDNCNQSLQNLNCETLLGTM